MSQRKTSRKHGMEDDSFMPSLSPPGRCQVSSRQSDANTRSSSTQAQRRPQDAHRHQVQQEQSSTPEYFPDDIVAPATRQPEKDEEKKLWRADMPTVARVPPAQHGQQVGRKGKRDKADAPEYYREDPPNQQVSYQQSGKDVKKDRWNADEGTGVACLPRTARHGQVVDTTHVSHSYREEKGPSNHPRRNRGGSRAYQHRPNQRDEEENSRLHLSPQTSQTPAAPTVTAAASSTADSFSDVRPGAYAIAGPRFMDYDDQTTSDLTIQVGGDYSVQQESPDEMTALDATVVHPQTRSAAPRQPPDASLPPLVEAQVDKSWSFRSRRVQVIAALVLLAVVGVVLGIVFGVVLTPSGGGDGPPAPEAPTISPAPTMSFAPTPAATILTWVASGGIDGIPTEFVSQSLSRDSTRLAVADPSGFARVYQEIQDGTWTELGNVIVQDQASSVSLSGDRIAVGSNAVNGAVRVLELVNDVWTSVGSAINSEGWNVALSMNGDIVATEASNAVRVFRLDDNSNDWLPRGDAISTTTGRVNEGNAYSRMAMSDDGTVLLVDLMVYQFDEGQDRWVGTNLNIESDPPDTPVCISGDGLVVAIGQPENSNINGLNVGRVRVFRFDGGEWNRNGGDIIGDGQVNGFFGFSHSLSEDGSRIAIMNNPPDGGQNQAVVYRLQGSTWIRLLDAVPVAQNNGTISISADGSRVAVGGEGIVRFFTVTGI